MTSGSNYEQTGWFCPEASRGTQAEVLRVPPIGLCGSSQSKAVFSFCVCVHTCTSACICTWKLGSRAPAQAFGGNTCKCEGHVHSQESHLIYFQFFICGLMSGPRAPQPSGLVSTIGRWGSQARHVGPNPQVRHGALGLDMSPTDATVFPTKPVLKERASLIINIC